MFKPLNVDTLNHLNVLMQATHTHDNIKEINTALHDIAKIALSSIGICLESADFIKFLDSQCPDSPSTQGRYVHDDARILIYNKSNPVVSSATELVTLLLHELMHAVQYFVVKNNFIQIKEGQCDINPHCCTSDKPPFSIKHTKDLQLFKNFLNGDLIFNNPDLYKLMLTDKEFYSTNEDTYSVNIFEWQANHFATSHFQNIVDNTGWSYADRRSYKISLNQLKENLQKIRQNKTKSNLMQQMRESRGFFWFLRKDCRHAVNAFNAPTQILPDIDAKLSNDILLAESQKTREELYDEQKEDEQALQILLKALNDGKLQQLPEFAIHNLPEGAIIYQNEPARTLYKIAAPYILAGNIPNVYIDIKNGLFVNDGNGIIAAHMKTQSEPVHQECIDAYDINQSEPSADAHNMIEEQDERE